MKRIRDVFILAIVLGALAYGGIYFACTMPQRTLLHEPNPELAWLKTKFDLPEAEFNRIAQLHNGYKPQCAEMCRRIDAINNELRTLLAEAQGLTPEIQTKLAAAAQVRLECQTMMLKHFLAVSRSMPPEQSKRYLDWVQENTLGPAHQQMTQEHRRVEPHSHHP